MQDAGTFGKTGLDFADEAEIDEFAETLARFERGELTADEWRQFRLVRGVYGQRQDRVQMVRVKAPQGVLDGAALRALAEVAEQWSRGFAHVTTRQNVQFHFVRPEHVEGALRRLAESGLTTREACGNAVRNVTACPLAGVARDEAFDVTPFAEAVTRHFLRHPLSASLPRKFKIAFEGCASFDHALTAINDVGCRALVRDGRRGFRVTVAGGTSTVCASGGLLFDFLPAHEVLHVAEAVLRVFHRLGDYQHRQRNRLKFLVRALGWEAWRAEFQHELDAVRASGGLPLRVDPDRPRATTAPRRAPLSPAGAAPPPGPWMATNVRGQRQADYSMVTATLPLGDVTSAQLREIASLAETYGDSRVRVTLDQNVLFRWVPDVHVPAVHARLEKVGLGLPGAGSAADVTSCPGAESCRLAVTRSRGLGRLLGETLRDRPALVDAAGPLAVRISGCPNGCGQHHVAGIGLQGSVRKLGRRAVPQYFVMVGGGVAAEGAHFARLAARVPARRVPVAVERLIAFYAAEGSEGETSTEFFRRLDVERVRAALADLERLTAAEATEDDYVDLGETRAYDVTAREGECGA